MKYRRIVVGYVVNGKRIPLIEYQNPNVRFLTNLEQCTDLKTFFAIIKTFSQTVSGNFYIYGNTNKRQTYPAKYLPYLKSWAYIGKKRIRYLIEKYLPEFEIKPESDECVGTFQFGLKSNSQLLLDKIK